MASAACPDQARLQERLRGCTQRLVRCGGAAEHEVEPQLVVHGLAVRGELHQLANAAAAYPLRDQPLAVHAEDQRNALAGIESDGNAGVACCFARAFAACCAASFR